MAHQRQGRMEFEEVVRRIVATQAGAPGESDLISSFAGHLDHMLEGTLLFYARGATVLTAEQRDDILAETTVALFRQLRSPNNGAFLASPLAYARRAIRNRLARHDEKEVRNREYRRLRRDVKAALGAHTLKAYATLSADQVRLTAVRIRGRSDFEELLKRTHGSKTGWSLKKVGQLVALILQDSPACSAEDVHELASELADIRPALRTWEVSDPERADEDVDTLGDWDALPVDIEESVRESAETFVEFLNRSESQQLSMIFRRKTLEGRTWEEIASELRLKRSTVYDRYNKLLQPRMAASLADCLEDEGGVERGVALKLFLTYAEKLLLEGSVEG